MQHRITFQRTICLAVVFCLPLASTYAQDSNSTRIQRAAKTAINDSLDPSIIESELIEAAEQEVRTLPSPFKKTSTQQQFSTNNQIDFGNQNQIHQPGNINQQNKFGQRSNFQTRTPSNRIQNQPTVNPQIGQNSRFQQQNTKPIKPFGSSLPQGIDKNMYETKSTPTIQTQIIAPRTTNVNQTARFFINAQNVGTDNVGNVKLIATLPQHAKFIGSTPEPTNVNGLQYEFTIDSLAARQKQIVQIDVTPTEKIPLNIGTQIQIESQQQVAVTVQQPVLEISVNGPETIQTGKTIKHQVVVKNIGDGPAESVRISTQRPEQLEIGNEQQKTLVPKLVPGQSAKFVLTSFARAAGDSNVTFQVSATGAETRQAQSQIRVIRPELGVQILGPSQNYVGRDGVYTIQLQNTSEMAITDVGVQLDVPNGLKIDTISQQAKIDKNSGTLSWLFTSIPGNQQQVIQFKAKAISLGNQICKVNVKTNETASRQMSLQTQVMGRADLSIRVSDSGEPVGIGSKSEFNIEVANHGSQTAEQVSIQVELPSALMPVNQPSYNIDPAGNFITFNNITVEAGKRKTFKFKVVAVDKGEHVVRGTVSLEGSTQKISSENSIFVFESENAKVSDALVPEIRR